MARQETDPNRSLPQARQPRTNLAGDDLGQLGTSRTPALTALDELGVRVPGSTIGRLRGGKIPGDEVALRIQSGELLLKDDASKKDSLYAKIARKALEIRTYRPPPHQHRPNSAGFTGELAENLGIDPQLVRRFIRAMRADLAYSDSDVDAGMRAKFTATATEFMRNSTEDTVHVSESTRLGMERMSRAWSGSISDFYRGMYSTGLNDRFIGTWTPYEVEIMADFYATRMDSGSRLSPFDRILLRAEQRIGGTQDVANEVRVETGILADSKVVKAHHRALLNGS